jgi:hypothetical protein
MKLQDAIFSGNSSEPLLGVGLTRFATGYQQSYPQKSCKPGFDLVRPASVHRQSGLDW